MGFFFEELAESSSGPLGALQPPLCDVIVQLSRCILELVQLRLGLGEERFLL